MQVTRTMLDAASTKGLLRADQAQPLWDFLAAQAGDTPSFRPAHILYYLGGMIAIGAMTLFMTLGWERFGGLGLLIVSLAYAAIALALAETLMRRPRMAIPAGILATLAVVMVPLAVYAGQHLIGLWPADVAGRLNYREYHTRIDWRWLMMELATLAAGAVALWRYRLPFLVMPVAVTLWYMSMDLAPFLLGGRPGDFFSDTGKLVSMVFGLLMTGLAFWVDVRSRHARDFAFWLYIFGVLAFWGGLSSMHSDSELNKFVYGCINVFMIGLGAALSRRVFAVFGALGVSFYLGHLSHTVFKDSLLFPLALTAIGLTVVGAGILWQRHEVAIGTRLRALLPAALRELVERRAGER